MADDIDYSKYGAPSKEVDYSQYGAKPQPKIVDTVLGKMQSNLPEYQTRTPENYNLINEMIASGGLQGEIMPGLKVIGNMLGRAGKLTTEPFRSAKPFEQAAEQAGQTHEAVLGEEPAATEKAALSNAQDQLNQHLNIGGVHKTDVAYGLTNRVNSIENYWKDAYSNFKDKIKDLHVTMPDNVVKNYNVDMDTIREALKQPGGLEKVKAGKVGTQISNPYLKDLMDIAPSSQETNASKFLEKYQDFKTKRFDLRQQMKTASTHAERNQIKEALNQSQAIESAANKALEQGLGQHAPEFARVNEGYSTQIYPLRSNPIIRKSKIGKLPSNIVDAIGSNEPGMPLVRELVKQDPQLLRNVVGQRYAVNSEEVLNPHAGMREFTNEMPELNKLLQQHQTASQNVENALENYAKRKDISLKNKIQAEKELNEMKKSRSKARYIGSGVLGMIGVPYAGRKILGYLNSGEE